MDDEQIWEREIRFWLKGSPALEDLLDPACLMVLPGRGVLQAADAIASFNQAPLWKTVALSDQALSRVDDSLIVLDYTAEAKRDGQKPYRCMCTSTCRADGQTWRMVQHQQSPAG